MSDVGREISLSSMGELSKKDIDHLKKLMDKRKKAEHEKAQTESRMNLRPKILAWNIHLTFRHGLPHGWGE